MTFTFPIVMAALVSGCEGGDRHKKLSPEVIVIDSSTLLHSDSLDLARGLYIFEPRGTPLSVEAGDIIVGPHGHGFLRRVTEASRRGSTLNLETSYVSLSEAVPEGSFDITIPLTDTDLVLAPEHMEATGRDFQLELVGPTTLDLASDTSISTVHSSDASLIRVPLAGLVLDSGSDFGLEIVSGTLELDLDVSMKGDMFPLRFRTLASGSIAGEMVIHTTAGSAVEVTKAQPIFTAIRPFRARVGWLPVSGAIRLDLVLACKASLKRAVSTTSRVAASAAVSVGAEYVDGGWRNLSSGEGNIDGGIEDPLQEMDQASLRVAIGPKVTVIFLGIDGPAIALDAYGQLDARVASPTGDWDASLSVGIDDSLEFNVDIIDRSIAHFVVDDPLVSRVVWNAPDAIEISSGNDQVSTVGVAATNPLVVRVSDSAGLPSSNVPVYFSTSDGGDVEPIVLTDSAGMAATEWVLGMKEGVQQVIADIRNADGQRIAAATFQATGTFCAEQASLPYIWIANNAEGTVSKIHTQSMAEEARYRVHENVGDPSRTSVSLSGDMSVANRGAAGAGVTKIYGDSSMCQERNGIPGLQTSSGADDILPWGEDECIAWHTQLEYLSNRPIAWTSGEWNPAACRREHEKIWTSGTTNELLTQVLLLDGETGVVEHSIDIPEIEGFLYGGAVDRDDNFWAVQQNGERIIMVDRNTLSHEEWPAPSPAYSITVDSQGRPWLCGGGAAARFDISRGSWDTTDLPMGIGGCMIDGSGTLWNSRGFDPFEVEVPLEAPLLVGIDTETLDVVAEIVTPEYGHGIAIDIDGNVWGVGFASDTAFRVDPDTGDIAIFKGLVGAYSYSDMTGFALRTVALD